MRKRQKNIIILVIIVILALALIWVASQYYPSQSTDLTTNTSSQTSDKAADNLTNNNNPRQEDLSNEQNLVKDYLSNHLSELSPEKEVLGGHFYLTDIKFVNDNQAQIAYEDGHIALSALVTYHLDHQGLQITDFSLLPEAEKQK